MVLILSLLIVVFAWWLLVSAWSLQQYYYPFEKMGSLGIAVKALFILCHQCVKASWSSGAGRNEHDL
jgi:hypothetical protein